MAYTTLCGQDADSHPPTCIQINLVCFIKEIYMYMIVMCVKVCYVIPEAPQILEKTLS